MQKPNNFENVQTGDFVPVEVGGHRMVIKAVEETTSKSGKPMLIVWFDFAQEDKQPAYFSDQFNKDIRPDKKWPRGGTQYVVTVDGEGNCSRGFKTFISCVEKSNGSFLVNWCDGAQFAEQFKGKRIGGVFGNVESEYNGERRTRPELRWFCCDLDAPTAKVPADKLMQTPAPVTTTYASAQASEDVGELPF